MHGTCDIPHRAQLCVPPWIFASYFAKSFNTLHEMLSINNQNSHIYWMVNKVGLAGNGAVRLAEYVKKLGAACPPIFSIIDIDNLPEVVQSELTKRMLTAISGFIPSVFPTTIEDAIHGHDWTVCILTAVLLVHGSYT
jgi:hypothetical protein